MATTVDRPQQAEHAPPPDAGAAAPPVQPEGDAPPQGPVLRPLLAAGLSSAAAGIATGGIFGSMLARAIGVAAAGLGVGYAALTMRRRRAVVAHALAFPAGLGLGIVSLIPDSDPSRLPALIREAVSSGRVFKPPVPFDPGWRPLLILFIFSLGFGAALIAASWERPQLAIALSLPVLGLTAISQPPEGEVLGGVVSFVLLLGAVAALYGGDLAGASELSSAFEVRRALRGLALVVPSVVVLVALSRGDFLFPEPRYNPASKPQKPKSIPLSQIEDKVLFEVEPPPDFTGPWRTGVLDVYDGVSWRLPPIDEALLQPVPADGAIDTTRPAPLKVTFTTRQIGNVAVLPGTVTPSRLQVQTPDVDVRWDPRSGVFRLASGRVTAGTRYAIELPPYPGPDELRAAPAPVGVDPEMLFVPRAPKPVEDMLAGAPPNAWERLELLRGRLYTVAIASGAGLASEVPPERVQEILVGNHEASPFELVAAEAMLARWAGVPSRIGFGFDGFNDEGGKFTVRPKNGSSWLEVYFEGFGWIPLIASPQQAKASLSADPNAKFDERIEASDDIAVEVYLPVRLENTLLFYEITRHYLRQAAPWAALLAALYFLWPTMLRTLRTYRRRRWGTEQGPRARIAVEYAEFRDLATDLNVGDPYATPIEYLDRLAEDPRHEEFAWLVTRAMYGDLAARVTDADARNAESMSENLRRRLYRAQPYTTRLLARTGRTSLRMPYTTEVPEVQGLRIPSPFGRIARPRRRRRGKIRVGGSRSR